MNFKMIRYTIGFILIFEALFMCIPALTALIYSERAIWSWLICITICLITGKLLALKKPQNTTLYAKEGYLIVALSWIVLSLFGAFPFIISGAIPSFIDALFETVSGFTTTGSSILSDVESLPRSMLMWRSFSHWVGGMGVLVFIIAFLPLSGGNNMHLMKAESTGPSVNKIVPRVKKTALILYTIYFSFTIVEFILLLFGGLDAFEAINIAFATAGTGGFAIHNNSLGDYSSYLQIVITVFMLLFSINFGSYFLLFTGKIKESFNCEVRCFLLIFITAVSCISINIYNMYGNLGEAIRNSAFTVSSIISTTGFSTVDFDKWPEFSQTIVVLVMFTGSCAGSTAGGIKISRILILIKGISKELLSMIHPNQIKKITIDKKTIEHETVRSVNVYIVCYLLIFTASIIIVSFEDYDLITNFTAVASNLNNVGPGLAKVGPTCNFGFLSVPTKLVLIFDMLAGRLELYPMLILFNRHTWKK